MVVCQMSRALRILLIEDHQPLVRALKKGLEEEGWEVDVATDGAEGDSKARSASYDAIILDLILPKVDGLTLLKQWRKQQLNTHVLILTGRGEPVDRVQGVNMGADDYLTKPFQFEELTARLRALSRRGPQMQTLRIYDLEIDPLNRTVQRAGKTIHLTPNEFAVLQLLAFHQGTVVSRSMILKHLYDGQDGSTSNVVDVFINFLRTKIDKGFDPALILTRRGEGYLLRGEE